MADKNAFLKDEAGNIIYPYTLAENIIYPTNTNALAGEYYAASENGTKLYSHTLNTTGVKYGVISKTATAYSSVSALINDMTNIISAFVVETNGTKKLALICGTYFIYPTGTNNPTILEAYDIQNITISDKVIML